MNEKAKEVKNAYMREYRKKHRDKLNEQARQRRKANPEKYKKYAEDFWERKAVEYEKAIPKKPVWRKHGWYREGKIAHKCCPQCFNSVSRSKDFCEACGQKIDWNERED